MTKPIGPIRLNWNTRHEPNKFHVLGFVISIALVNAVTMQVTHLGRGNQLLGLLSLSSSAAHIRLRLKLVEKCFFFFSFFGTGQGPRGLGQMEPLARVGHRLALYAGKSVACQGSNLA